MKEFLEINVLCTNLKCMFFLRACGMERKFGTMCKVYSILEEGNEVNGKVLENLVEKINFFEITFLSLRKCK